MFLKDEGKSIKYEEKGTNEGRWFHSQTQRPQFTLSTSNGCNCQTTCAHRTTHLKARSFRSISLRPRNEPNPYNKSLHIERERHPYFSLYNYPEPPSTTTMAAASASSSLSLLPRTLNHHSSTPHPNRLSLSGLTPKTQALRTRHGRRARATVRAAAVETLQKADTSLVEKSINTIRFLSIDAVEKANSGHPGLPMGCAPMGHILYDEVMRYNPSNPYWFNRDRFVLSAGHGCMLQYALLHLAGYDSVKVNF